MSEANETNAEKLKKKLEAMGVTSYNVTVNWSKNPTGEECAKDALLMLEAIESGKGKLMTDDDFDGKELAKNLDRSQFVDSNVKSIVLDSVIK